MTPGTMCLENMKSGRMLPARAKKEGAKYGYIDKSGNVVIDCQFRSAGKFKEGLAPVSFLLIKKGLYATKMLGH